MTEKKNTYASAGVNIKAGEDAVQRIKHNVRSTFTSSVLTDIGKFGGFFELPVQDYEKPVLVSSIDGVGTKLKVAFMMNKHDTVGEDLVNHCINDILVGGAKPLFFLDYIGTGVLEPHVMEEIVAGMVRGCKQAQCALIGGEMAEMPGFYSKGEYDVAGSIVGIVEKDKIIDGRDISAGDVMIGLPSTGLHTNGYSLARKVLFEDARFKVDSYVDSLNSTVGESLLKVHRSYLEITRKMLAHYPIHGMSHVTGGGLVGNTSRIIPEDCRLSVDWNSWPIPPIFSLIQEKGKISDVEMQKAFNVGVGFIYIVSKTVVSAFIKLLQDEGEMPFHVGEIVSSL